jgi:hypothetical protein
VGPGRRPLWPPGPGTPTITPKGHSSPVPVTLTVPMVILEDREVAGAAGPADVPPARRFPLAVPSQRVLQIVLGFFWLLDAALQFQPFMFGQGFVGLLQANASGQPFVVGDLITHVSSFLSPDIAVWNVFFALIQLAIAIGLFYKPTVRAALTLSFFWVAGVWFFGEGMGMLLTGSATALTGAPGSVFVYGLLGLMAWPRGERRAGAHRHHPDQSGETPDAVEGDESDAFGGTTVGIASSAAAQGIGRSVTPLAVWAGYWSLAAVLFLFPDNRTSTSLNSAISGMVPTQPPWYGHFLNSVSSHVAHSGTGWAWVLAVAALVIGLGPLLVRRPGPYLLAGALLSFGMWMTGQGLFGNVFSGSATDPNTAPLIILLAASMVPLVAVPTMAAWRSPAAHVFRRVPALATLAAVGLGAALALAATYPPAAPETAGSAMAGMNMGGSSAAGTAAAGTSTCHPNQVGLKIAGLDLANSPYMSMGGSVVMNMNGADASAAAGLNTTKENWHYTGPAFPAAFAQELEANGGNGPSDIHMAISGCARSVTPAQQIEAVQHVQQTSAAVSGYATPADAMAAGYVPVSPTDYPVVYYVNPDIVAANADAKRTLSPAHVDGLVYATTPSGQQVLAGAMYILPSTVSKVPMPYGPLVQWHQRTAVCGTGTTTATMPLAISGFPPCASGSRLEPTPYVSMVWQVPVAGGPLAIQPPDLQIVQAAVMQSSGS